MSKNYIALFRGINVGGHNSLPMSELVAILATLNAQNIKTYIQSGNAVFQSAETAQALALRLSEEIQRQKGFAPWVLILEQDQWGRAMAANPFPQAEQQPNQVHLGFLASAPTDAQVQKLQSLKAADEQFAVVNQVFYLYAPSGIGRSKLAAGAEKCLGVAMTVRNWRTVCKLRELV